MLEVLFNDSASDLTLVNIPNKEALAIVDSDFKVYGTMSYNPFEPSNEDLERMWEIAARAYFNIDSESDDTLLVWRTNSYDSSNKNFKEFLKTQNKYLLATEDEIKRVLTHLCKIGECEETLMRCCEYHDVDWEETDVDYCKAIGLEMAEF